MKTVSVEVESKEIRTVFTTVEVSVPDNAGETQVFAAAVEAAKKLRSDDWTMYDDEPKRIEIMATQVVETVLSH